MGYRRPDGAPGARNHLVVVSAMDNANPLARRIGKLVREAVVVNTTFGRNLFGEDERQHYRVMGRTAGHPNVGAAIVVSLEPKSAQDVADVAAEASPWMPIETLTVHETGGTLRTANRGGGDRPEAVPAPERCKAQAVQSVRDHPGHGMRGF